MNLSIRLFGKVLATVLIVIFFIFIFFIKQLSIKVEEEREFRSNANKMIDKAQELRHSSNYLSRFARTYVVTKDISFKNDYYRVLDIRNAKVPKPYNYKNIYWGLKEPLRSKRHPEGTNKISIKDEMYSLPYTKFQIQKFIESQKKSDELVNIELKAFNAMQDNNQELAIKLLYSQKYYKVKEKIMLPIDELLESIEKRQDKVFKELDKVINDLFKLILLLVISGISVFFISLFVLRKKVLIPIEYLIDVIDKIKHGKKDYKKIIFCKDEIGMFTEQLFTMKEQRDRDFEELRQLSITDPLTNTKNRRAFFESSEKFFKLARRKEHNLCIVLIDIDHFKNVNDTYGHIIGDEILKFLVKQVDKTLRDSDILARYGGEEFIVLLPDTDLKGGVRAAEKIRSTIEETPYKGDVEVAITISLGVAQLENEKIINDLIKKSDEALYKAKENGRNRVETN